MSEDIRSIIREELDRTFAQQADIVDAQQACIITGHKSVDRFRRWAKARRIERCGVGRYIRARITVELQREAKGLPPAMDRFGKAKTRRTKA